MKRIYFGMFLALTILGGSFAAQAARIYVNISNTNTIQDGSSWAKAYASLQSALNQAQSTIGPDEIWVATGVYIPSQIYSPNGVIGGASGLNTPFLQTFNLPDQVAIYGGFAGIEKKLDERNPKINPTTLSGIIPQGKVWHVVTLGNDIQQSGVRAKLDGLIISNGDASGPSGGVRFFAPFVWDHSLGGGVYSAFDSDLDINDLIFVNNTANLNGGGVDGTGGAIGAINTDLHVKCSKFNDNSSFTSGGAIQTCSIYESRAHHTLIEDSTFTNNTTGLFGGAIVSEGVFPRDDSCSTIKHCSFVNNSADEGGAIVFDSFQSYVLDSRFVGNTGSVSAGALATTNVVSTFVNAQKFGPNAPFTKYSTTVSNSVFINNVALGDKAIHDAMFGGPGVSGIDSPLGGGALVSYINGILKVSDSKFIANHTKNGPGGAILNGNSSGVNIIGTGAVAFEASTQVEKSKFINNSSEQTSNILPNILGNGGAIASQPGMFFNIPSQNIRSIRLAVKESEFIKNFAGGNGGAIYLNASFAKLKDNKFKHNRAAISGDNIFAVGSIIEKDHALINKQN